MLVESCGDQEGCINVLQQYLGGLKENSAGFRADSHALGKVEITSLRTQSRFVFTACHAVCCLDDVLGSKGIQRQQALRKGKLLDIFLILRYYKTSHQRPGSLC